MASSKSKNALNTTSTSTSNLIAEVSAKFNEVPKRLTKDIVTSFLEMVETHVTSGKKVRLDKLGILTVKDRAARKGRNPQSGEEIQIPASKKVAFRVSTSLKEAIGIMKKKALKQK